MTNTRAGTSDPAVAPTGRRLVVIGGGISGLAAAWFAAERGWAVTVLEAGTQLGGKVRSESLAGARIDVGAEAMVTTRPEGIELLTALGLDGERIAPATTSARLYAVGESHPIPARTMLGIPGDPAALRESGALSEAAVAAVANEPTRVPLEPLRSDVTVGALVRQRLGDEVADRLVDPLLGGVYAGRADGLSLRATIPALAEQLADGGSLVAAVRALTGSNARRASAEPVFTSLRGGLGRLPDALADSGRFEVRTGVLAREIRRAGDGFVIECGAVPTPNSVAADAVIVAVPAGKAARLLGTLAPSAARELAAVDSASVAIVSFAFPACPATPGSGLLVASGERLATKAVTISSQKWPMADGGMLLLRASVGRAGEPLALQLADEDLIELVRREVRALVGVDAEPIEARLTRWGGALPQYGLGHPERVARIRSALAEVPGLAACGAAFDGVGIPACIGSARTAVAAVDRAAEAAVDRVATENAMRGQ